MQHEHKEKIKDITDSLANYFDKEEVEVGVVMSVLLTMCVHTMLKQGGIPPQDAIMIFSQAVCHAVDNDEEEIDDDENNEGEMQWLN
jgi:Na+/citrate or Na+/malate symporter